MDKIRSKFGMLPPLHTKSGRSELLPNFGRSSDPEVWTKSVIYFCISNLGRSSIIFRSNFGIEVGHAGHGQLEGEQDRLTKLWSNFGRVYLQISDELCPNFGHIHPNFDQTLQHHMTRNSIEV